MALNDLGIEVPQGTDLFNPDGDMRDLGESMAGRIIVPVANTTERATLVANYPPSTSRPVFVYRADATQGQRVEYTVDGVTWLSLRSNLDDNPWTTLTAINGWTAGTGSNAPQVRRTGDIVFFKGSFFGGTANTQATTLPTWARPSFTQRPVVIMSDGSAGRLRMFTSGAVNPSGNLDGESVSMWTVV